MSRYFFKPTEYSLGIWACGCFSSKSCPVCTNFIRGKGSHLSLTVFIFLLQATDNVSQNTIVEYIMINSIFEAVIQVIFRVFISFIVMNTLWNTITTLDTLQLFCLIKKDVANSVMNLGQRKQCHILRWLEPLTLWVCSGILCQQSYTKLMVWWMKPSLHSYETFIINSVRIRNVKRILSRGQGRKMVMWTLSLFVE